MSLYSGTLPGRISPLFGAIRGCHCARNVIATIKSQRTGYFSGQNDEIRTPHEIASWKRKDETASPNTVHQIRQHCYYPTKNIDRENYVWLSPLGEKNHAQRLARTTKIKPMITLALVSMDCINFLSRKHERKERKSKSKMTRRIRTR